MCDGKAGEIVFAVDDPRRRAVVQVLERHLAFAREHSAPEDVHALDVSGLVEPAITFCSATVGTRVLAIGALRRLDDSHGEIKSMHTVSEARGTGLGRLMAEHLLSVARSQGLRRVSLETGTMDSFGPARTLYERLGFVECEPFGDYWVTDASVCMTITLD